MSAHRIEIYRAATQDGDVEYRWRKVSIANDEPVSWGEGHPRRWVAIRAAVRANPDVCREHVVDISRGGIRVQSTLLETLPSEADDA